MQLFTFQNSLIYDCNLWQYYISLTLFLYIDPRVLYIASYFDLNSEFLEIFCSERYSENRVSIIFFKLSSSFFVLYSFILQKSYADSIEKRFF